MIKMNDEIKYILESLSFKASIYRDKSKRNLTYNDDEYYSNILYEYITELQNNWNELKKWCKENQYNDNFDSYQVDNYTTYGVILKKMEELEVVIMIDDAIIKVAKELDELKEERVEYTVNNIAYKYEIECLKKEKKQLQNNWNELKKGLQSLFEFDEGVVSKDYLECAEDTLEKMQKMESGNNER